MLNAVSAEHPHVLQAALPGLTTSYDMVEERLREDMSTCGSFWISMPFLSRGHGEASRDMLRGSPGTVLRLSLSR